MLACPRLCNVPAGRAFKVVKFVHFVHMMTSGRSSPVPDERPFPRPSSFILVLRGMDKPWLLWLISYAWATILNLSVSHFHPFVNAVPQPEKADPMKLADCLSMTPHCYLVGIAQTYHLPDPRHTPKADLLHRLATLLADSTALQPVFDHLSLQEQAALHRLVAHHGRLALPDFTHAFGPIRPYRPWRRDDPSHPWRRPVSTAETLLYKGLIYLTPSDPQHRQPQYVVLPTEFLQRITYHDPPAVAQPAPHDEPPSPAPFDPLLDLALFLAYLQATDVRPLHGRWLSPRHLQALGACLSPPLPGQDVRSEFQAGRIHFIHFLADSLGLVFPVSNLLKPSPTALAWLSQPPSTQLEALWQAWLSPSDANHQRWSRYRLPGYTLRDPVSFAQRLIQLMATFSANAWWSLAALLHSPHMPLDQLIPWWEREQGDPAGNLLHETLAGPLSWLGIVSYNPGSDPSQARWHLTPRGAWLLGRTDASPPQDDVQSLILAENLVLTLPSQPLLAGLLALAEWTEVGPGPQLHLTPGAMTRAWERGPSAWTVSCKWTRNGGRASLALRHPSLVIRLSSFVFSSVPSPGVSSAPSRQTGQSPPAR
jgi:hypothetical protein